MTSPTATISTLQFLPLLAALDGLGIDGERVLECAGLSRAVLSDREARIRAELDRPLWEAVAAESGDPAIALRIAQNIAPGAFDTIAERLADCENLAQVLERANENMRLLDDLAELKVYNDGTRGRVQLRRKGDFPMAAQSVEYTLALIASIPRELRWPLSRLYEVHFTHAAGAPLVRYEEFFGCHVRFESEANELIAHVGALQLQPGGDTMLRRVPDAQDPVEHSPSQLPCANPFLQAVTAHMHSLLQRGDLTDTTLARALHMSERTMRRRLEGEGTRYQELLDKLREQLAIDYVTQHDLDGASIADRLGFADPSTFYRAFKRWTGTTPAQYVKGRKSAS